MRKVFCDRCERDCSGKVNVVSYQRHIVEGSGYITREGDAVSGRMVDFDLCQKCYNEVSAAAYAKLVGGRKK